MVKVFVSETSNRIREKNNHPEKTVFWNQTIERKLEEECWPNYYSRGSRRVELINEAD